MSFRRVCEAKKALRGDWRGAEIALRLHRRAWCFHAQTQFPAFSLALRASLGRQVRAQKVTPVYAELTLYDQEDYIEMYPKHQWIKSVVNTHPVHDRYNNSVEDLYYKKYGGY